MAEAVQTEKDGEEQQNQHDRNEFEYKPPKSWDEFQKQNKKKQQTKIYNKATVKSNFKKKYKSNKHEKETDALFAGSGNKKKNRNKNKKKKQKEVLDTAVYHDDKHQYMYRLSADDFAGIVTGNDNQSR